MIDRITAPYGALMLRVALGAALLIHAHTQLFGLDAAGGGAIFGAGGDPTLGVATFIELLAGVAMIAGIGARWAALAAIPVMLAPASAFAGYSLSSFASGGGWSIGALGAAVAVAVALVGDGAFALTETERAEGVSGRKNAAGLGGVLRPSH